MGPKITNILRNTAIIFLIVVKQQEQINISNEVLQVRVCVCEHTLPEITKHQWKQQQ